MSVAETFDANPPRRPNAAAPALKAEAPQAPANQNTDEVPLKTWIAVIGATLGAFLAVLNIQIVNSSLADIQGAIGAGIDDGGWVSTSYLVTEIIVIPLSGWFASVFSMRIYLLVSTVLFLAFSVACAYAGNLSEMIILRAFQGFSGGALIPLAFTIIVTMVPGLIMLGMLVYGLPKAKMQLGLLKQGDWLGIVTMAIGLGALQTFLEEGNKDDWFGSEFITNLAITAAIALGAFLVIELTVKRPLLNLRLLLRRNFGLGTVSNVLLGAALYGSSFILPLYLSQVQGYNAEQIGEVLAWTGIPQLILIPLVPRLMKVIDSRVLIGIGFLLFAGSNFMNVFLTNDYSGPQLFWPNV